MSRGVNKAIIIGNLGADPEVKYTPAGVAVCNISIATSEQWKDKESGEKKEKTEWHRIVLFGRRAEVAGEFLKKGSRAYIEGKLQTRKWEDKDGITRYTTEIVGLDMQLLDSKGGSGKKEQSQYEAAGPQVAQGSDELDDDIPF